MFYSSLLFVLNFISLLEPVHIVDIEVSSNSTTAGGNYSLICTVFSDFPPTVQWLDAEGNEVDVFSDSMTINQQFYGKTTILTLNFDPLKTSHSGLYSCVSNITQFVYKRNTTELVVDSKLLPLTNLFLIIP